MTEEDRYDRDQLRPTVTPQSNSVLRAPEGMDNCGDLHVELVPDDDSRSVITCSTWTLDARQRALVAAGANMRMSVWQHPIPPLALSIEPPFCDSCGVLTVFVWSEGKFACPSCEKRVQHAEDDRDAARAAEKQVRADFSPAADDDLPPAA